MLLKQKQCGLINQSVLLWLLLFGAMHSSILHGSELELDEVGALAGESPGEGYGPDLLTDNENIGGVLSFVAPKGDRCERLVMQLTPSAIEDKIKIEIAQHKRVPNNHKWKKQKDEQHLFTIWDPAVSPDTEKRPIAIEYNHAGHKGIHGGGTARDTHHNWGIRLTKNGKYLTADPEQWKKYLRIIFSSFRPSMENTYHGSTGVGTAYMTLEEANKLSAWNFLSPTGKALITEVEDEIERLERDNTETVSPDMAEALEGFGLALKKDENGQWLIWGTKSKIKGSTTHKCTQDLGIGGVSDRVIVTLKK